ncbi:MAG: glutamate-1-semialdehyde 2,1-aminomutase [Candidatus Riflebacteria bacterium]|nr:glutamate-1-semialdehyde 2,1-aminomutase [Candidatus Riflebacteria bacterium]
MKRIKNFAKGDQIQKRLEEMVPGGSHTYSKGESQFPEHAPKIISHAKGAYCWDMDGNKFLDWGMGIRISVLGHSYPVVDEAVKKQIDLGTNFTRPSILEFELAQYLTNLWPCAEMVKFGKNGSDVTTAAIKLSRAFTGRKYVAVCKDHPFFSVGDWFIGTTPCNSGIPEEISSLTLSFGYNDITSLETLFAKYPKQIAAIILEPVKNDKPKPGYLQQLRNITSREGTILIFDEIVSGLRFDIRGAHHLYKVMPDLATFGKAIANGYSCSVLAGKKEIMELGGLHHSKPKVFLLSQTHSSETIGLAATLATLKECERVNISQYINQIGKKLVSGVRELAQAEKVQDFVRVIGFDCNPQILCTKKDGTFWPELHTSFHEEVIANGVLIPWTSITYSHTENELEITFEALRMGMKKVQKALETSTVEKSFFGKAIKPVFRKYNNL